MANLEMNSVWDPRNLYEICVFQYPSIDFFFLMSKPVILIWSYDHSRENNHNQTTAANSNTFYLGNWLSHGYFSSCGGKYICLEPTPVFLALSNRQTYAEPFYSLKKYGKEIT